MGEDYRMSFFQEEEDVDVEEEDREEDREEDLDD